jgi:hypothetical protein
VNFAAPTAERVHSSALRAGKCGDFRLRQILRFGGPGNVRFSFGLPFLDDGKSGRPRRVGALFGGRIFRVGLFLGIVRDFRILRVQCRDGENDAHDE